MYRRQLLQRGHRAGTIAMLLAWSIVPAHVARASVPTAASASPMANPDQNPAAPRPRGIASSQPSGSATNQ